MILTRALSVTGLILSVAVCGMASAQETEIPVVDLGVREVGQNDTLKLTAQNIDCDAPQDFEFQLDQLPWVFTDGPPVLRGLGPGQRASVPARVDLKHTPPGTYFGRLTTHCITCGWYVFAACEERGQDVVLKVSVIDPALGKNQKIKPGVNPYAGMSPFQPVPVILASQLGPKDVAALGNAEREKLLDARRRMKAAAAAGQQAAIDLRAAQRGKSDCERKLAELRAKANAAKGAQGAAKAKAKTSEKASAAAAKRLSDYERDHKKAFKYLERVTNETMMAAAYRSLVREEDGTKTQRYKEAQEQVDRFNDKQLEAFGKHSDIKASRDERAAAAQKAADAARADKGKAETARAAYEAAKLAYENQIKICKGEADKVAKAKTKLSDAEQDAIDKVKAANEAEKTAKEDAKKALDDKIKDQKGKCDRGRKEGKAEIARLTNAYENAQKLGILDADGGRRVDMIRKVNDKIWDAAQDWAQDHTLVTTDKKGNLGLANDATTNGKDFAEDMLGRATWVMNGVLEGIDMATGIGGGVIDFQQGELFTGLKGLALAIQGQINAIRNPNTIAAKNNQSNDLRRGDGGGYLINDMKDKGIGKNRKERDKLQADINEIFEHPTRLTDRMAQYGERTIRCNAQLKALKAQRAALGK